ncbi:hypothetical protein PR048_017344 [Dryococelus australis]|uniref:Integrase catalytic domain-containing protein n=1 Tax=Dryococelus australis TaxID=614101 RepID=A0ABQ9H989_9NEOP|nr:hypothetical protein PR048_017344 [Dryococelus australis]
MSVWWFGLSSQLEIMISNCPTCVQERQSPGQLFVQSERPSSPWQIVAIYLFKCVAWYLIEMFARFGIPEIVWSDNGSQFVSSNFQSFANTYIFRSLTVVLRQR